ncbi:hypothetical protein H0E87_031068 [Populus deltoides]|uniref:Uncharacterized protein n=1 Tax=Populus deltoides TaxID=3696 RepID=A0A8T2WI58_POPDE|nr:hypothetical protein H0E87_031068 [Populus deltoides]
MEGVPPSFNEDDVNLTSNQFDFQSPEDSFNISELLSSPPEVPGNQSFMLCNDHVGQNMVVNNNVINDSIQQTTQFPPSFPQTMMEGFPPSSAEDDVVIDWTSNEFDLQSLEDIFNIPEPLSSPPEVPDNQSSILCNDQGGQNDTTMGGLDGTSSSRINQNEPKWPQTPSRYLPHPNLFDPRCAYPMLPGPSMPLRSQYFSNQGQVDQAAVIPNIDNGQQENFVPRSQMDNLQVRGLQNQTARPNASNPGPDTSLQSQNRGLNTQQVRSITELS